MAEPAEWLGCSTRRPWIANSLKATIRELRSSATRCRKAYQQPYMREPCTWLADRYDEAADGLQRALSAILESEKING